MIIPSLFGAWVVIVAWTLLIKVVIFYDPFFVLPFTVYFYFLTKLNEHNKSYWRLLNEITISESLKIAKTTEMVSQMSSFSQTSSYLTSYFVSHPTLCSSLFQTFQESFKKCHRNKHQYIKRKNHFKLILGTIVEVKETLDEYLGSLPYPPPNHSFLEKHRQKHIRKRDQFRFIPILGTIQEVSNDYLGIETCV
ncbi:hypothetical protein NPIL_495971 [Nephila pilipes]|uniref:Uncharacterized protein n=1 Tax=Nephila pilipes TaxID=299642 RepID=A0A8X6P3A9_NEPPI|nr:hypothetical protein NPIL_495971 [Nephila pilipes]